MNPFGNTITIETPIYDGVLCRIGCILKKPPKNFWSAKSLIFCTKTNEIFTNLYSDKTRFKAQHKTSRQRGIAMLLDLVWFVKAAVGR